MPCIRLPCLILLLLLATGCRQEQGHGEADQANVSKPAAGSRAPAAYPAAAPATASSRLAGYPDRGALLEYTSSEATVRGLRNDFAKVSEAHALSATRPGGVMRLPLPDGSQLLLAYRRHVEHADGNWTWIGRTAEGRDALITFGDEAVFGNIDQPGGEPLRLVTRAGRVSLLQLDPSRVRDGNRAPRAADSDARVPPLGALLAKAGRHKTQAAVGQVASEANTVDIMLGYTTGYASALGGASAAVTRLHHLVDLTNQGYANSQLDASLRLVGTTQVGYTDSNANDTALDDLTGYTCTTTSCSPRTVPASLVPLRNARESTSADVVSLVRDFRTPENEGCGIAWLIGGEQGGIDNESAPFAYSIVSDGTDIDEGDGNNYFCRDETLAHEVGHNMGQAHNIDDSGGNSGAHTYSYGYREASSSGFYTIMAYRRADSSQFSITYFANPAVSYAGRPTGTASADNVRSMRQTIPLISAFRASQVPVDTRPDLFAIRRTGAGASQVNLLTGASAYAQQTGAWSSALGATGPGYAWAFRAGDYDRNGSQDIYVLKKQGANGRLEVHVLDGNRQFGAYLLHIATPLSVGLGNRWVFDLGDYNGDGVLDLYAIDRSGGSGRTDVHVLNGANRFQSFLLHVATALPQTGSDLSWRFDLGDFNRDGRDDLFAIKRNGSSGNTEVHVLNGVNRFQSFLVQRALPLASTGNADDWDFKAGDYNRDGVPDLYAIKKLGSTRTEVHVIDGAGGFRAWLAHRATALARTGSDGAWMFDLASE